MNKRQQAVLAAFADMNTASSKHETLGHTAGGDIDDVVSALCAAGYLIALPYSLTSDAHGGTRFKVSDAGFAALGRKPTLPAKAKGVRVLNGPRAKRGA